MHEFTQWKIIGKGVERICYQNPDDKARCIKVSRKADSKQSLREIKYFKFLMKKGKSFDHIPKFYGVIENSEYLGIEQELILDDSGQVSKTVYNYLLEPRTQDDIVRLNDALIVLKNYLLENNIIPSNLSFDNLLVTNTSNGIKINLIDGLGGKELIPLSNYFNWLGQYKINKKWNQFMFDYFNPEGKKLHQLHKNRHSLLGIFNQQTNRLC